MLINYRHPNSPDFGQGTTKTGRQGQIRFMCALAEVMMFTVHTINNAISLFNHCIGIRFLPEFHVKNLKAGDPSAPRLLMVPTKNGAQMDTFALR